MTLGNTFGVAFIGLIISSVMYGLTLLQTFHYYRRYTHDPIRLKWIVGLLTLADSIQLMLSVWAIYWYLVANFGNFPNLGVPHWSINLQTDFNTIVSAGVQLFFTRRVYIMSQNKYILVILLVLTAIHFALGVYFTARAFIYHNFADYLHLVWVPSVGVGSAAVADLIIATSMCYFLRKTRTGFGRTDTLITKLMMYSINTGLLTSIFATVSVILYGTMPNNLVWMCFYWILGKLYINSFLAMLNSRGSLRELANPPNGMSYQISGSHDGSMRVSRVSKTEIHRYPDEMPPQSQMEVVVSMDPGRTGSLPTFNHTEFSSSSRSKEVL
ncbi:hypothetical protein BD410DRAFT_789355 [Rickenella mellea]|uniref:DUF6534 domain-containing protein n=1 Tax=Rickenella mellea TaxID=50990 RepID=A0A4Y7Q3X4_9AGAM|nr:hypothetical protein BD410DRAFT_789355 [Rickenella mellea]